jgi:hypothetical protein
LSTLHRTRTFALIAGVVLAACGGNAGAERALYVAPDGDDANDGLSLAAPLATLSRAHELVDLPAHGDHQIYVRGGRYHGQSVGWVKHSATSSITIEAYAEETPVFDGIRDGHMQPFFIYVSMGRGGCSNVTIRGLTIRHYLHWGVVLGDSSGEAASWSGCNLIENNVLEKIGDLYLPPPYICSSTQRGYAAIMLENSGNNVIRNNVFENIENCRGAEAFMHAVYLYHGSSNNRIYANYISMTSGDTMRVRDASNDNHFYGNHAERSGTHGFIAGWRNISIGERPSSGNIVENNIVILPYPAFESIELICRSKRGVCDESTFIDRGQAYFDAGRASRPWLRWLRSLFR